MSTIRTLGAGLFVALVLSLAAVGFTATSASAAPAPVAHAKVRDGYGAITLNATGHYGVSRNYPTRHGAYQRALQECNKGGSKYKCVKIGWVRNACAAAWFQLDSRGFVSSKQGSKPHFAWARSLSQAIREARNGHRGGHIVKTCT